MASDQWKRWSVVLRPDRSGASLVSDGRRGSSALASPHGPAEQHVCRLLRLSRTRVVGRIAVVERITSRAGAGTSAAATADPTAGIPLPVVLARWPAPPRLGLLSACLGGYQVALTLVELDGLCADRLGLVVATGRPQDLRKPDQEDRPEVEHVVGDRLDRLAGEPLGLPVVPRSPGRLGCVPIRDEAWTGELRACQSTRLTSPYGSSQPLPKGSPAVLGRITATGSYPPGASSDDP
jgi:hypothetical protein